MRNIEEIIVNKVALSVLDKENNNIIFTDSEMELNEETYEYFEKHILKGLKDEEARTAKFEGEHNIIKSLCNEIFEDEDTYLDNSKKIAQYLFKCINNEDKEASGDIAVCMFESQQGKFLAILKLNFTDAYSHHVKQTDNSISVVIGKNKTGLPSLGQKAAKAMFVREIKPENDYDMLIVDRQRDGYFSQGFAKCSYARDRRENTRVFHKISENFARKAFKDNAQEAEAFRSKLTETLFNENKVDIERVAQNNFGDEIIKKEYKAALLTEGITEKEVEIDREWVEKKLKKKRLKVDKSIELYIDNEVYNDKEKFQIKRNGDGTIDIILKNIKNYIEK